MFDQIFGEIRSQIGERLSNPLAGSFLISWCVWNYKFFVILLSRESVVSTFELIERVVFPDAQSVFLKGLLYPALTAAIYIFLYPYPARFVYKFSRSRQREIAEIRRVIEEETPLTMEQSRKIRTELARIEAEHSQQLERKDREIERLKSQSISIDFDGDEKIVELNSKKKPLITDSQLKMLIMLEGLNGEGEEERMIRESESSKIKAEYDLGELVNNGLLSRDYERQIGDYVYKFTHDGRSFLISYENTPLE